MKRFERTGFQRGTERRTGRDLRPVGDLVPVRETILHTLVSTGKRLEEEILPTVGSADAKHFPAADTASFELSALEMDTIAAALRACHAPESLIRRFATA